MPQPSDNPALSRQSASLTDDEARYVRWAGWAILGTVLLGWFGWLSLLAIANRTDITRNTERIEQHYQQINRGIDDVKADVKALLQRQIARSGE